MVSQTLKRVKELYEDGGITEVFRGTRDYLGLTTIHAHLINKKSLSVDGTEVYFIIEEEEDLKRARGHGELDVLQDFVDEVRPGDTVWDVGANVGTYSLFAAKQGASTVAFEPASDALSRLRKNIELNSVDISVMEIALADEEGTRNLIDTGKSGHRKLSDGDGETVKVRRGDALELEQPDVIKIDVEGAEHEVLHGMRENLSGARVCYVELHEGVDQSSLIELLQDEGFNNLYEFGDGVVRELTLMKFRKSS
ncbi:FkbM family methyltransferase [Halonotius sp. F2-221B]|uniref:FkbM family methyltransferase n=1 Tax=Halonotius sp. F2-221B TaxID=2731620 RepID=UPI00398B1C55